MLLQTHEPRHDERPSVSRERTGEPIERRRAAAAAASERAARTAARRAGDAAASDAIAAQPGGAAGDAVATRPDAATGDTVASRPPTAPVPVAPARPLRALRAAAVALAALLAGTGVAVLELRSGHREAPAVWAVFAPAVGWSFVGTGLYAWRRRPENRTGALMVCLGFAWFLFALDAADAPALYTVALVAGGMWGGVFLHLGLSFPAGRLEIGRASCRERV